MTSVSCLCIGHALDVPRVMLAVAEGAPLQPFYYFIMLAFGFAAVS